MTRFAWGLALLAVVACSHARAPVGTAAGPMPNANASLEGKQLDFDLEAYPSHARHHLHDDRGYVVLLDVWATWCDPCREALPTYQQLAATYAARGLRVYALNVDEDARLVPSFLAQAHLTLPVLLDPDAAFAEPQLHVRVMPTTFLLDRHGVVRHVHEGFSGGHSPELAREIETLLAEPAN